MSEEKRIAPEVFVKFLPFLADVVLDGLAKCMGKGWQKWVKGQLSHKSKPEELEEVERAVKCVVIAVQMGLLLAKRQPELVDVGLREIELRGESVDEQWQALLEAYQGFLEFDGREYSERGEINPEHFGEFLAYFASCWLRDMSKVMGKEWQKEWQKWFKNNPLHKVKPEERAAVKTVGNYAIVAILVGLLLAKKQPELLGADWSRGASLDMLWKGMLETYGKFQVDLFYEYFAE